MTFDKEKLALDLAYARVKKKLNLRQAASEIGISSAQLNRIERQKCDVQVNTLCLICDWLNFIPNRYFNP